MECGRMRQQGRLERGAQREASNCWKKEVRKRLWRRAASKAPKLSLAQGRRAAVSKASEHRESFRRCFESWQLEGCGQPSRMRQESRTEISHPTAWQALVTPPLTWVQFGRPIG
ncbi:hypothetical protein LZ30DRAFT_163117 [Colletotrichum cereale]|nr:hypothetical protein LZ30DRAFT_163117 [Colletotrichum cereale]